MSQAEREYLSESRRRIPLAPEWDVVVDSVLLMWLNCQSCECCSRERFAPRLQTYSDSSVQTVPDDEVRSAIRAC